MNIIDKLHVIEEVKCIYNIHYCRAGVGFIFYYSDKDTADGKDSWKEALSVDGYYETFEEAVNAEYKKIRPKKNYTWRKPYLAERGVGYGWKWLQEGQLRR